MPMQCPTSFSKNYEQPANSFTVRLIMQLVEVATLTHCTAVPHPSTSTQVITAPIAVQGLEKCHYLYQVITNLPRYNNYAPCQTQLRHPRYPAHSPAYPAHRLCACDVLHPSSLQIWPLWTRFILAQGSLLLENCSHGAVGCPPPGRGRRRYDDADAIRSERTAQDRGCHRQLDSATELAADGHQGHLVCSKEGWICKLVSTVTIVILDPRFWCQA